MSRPFIALGSLLTLSTLNLASSIPVLAQLRSIDGHPIDQIQPDRQVPTTQVDASALRVNRRAPMQFEAFDLKDPETGKLISADQMLTLPDGKQVRAGEYYAELNRFEQEFSQLGYSLRQPEEKVLLQESPIDQTALQRQVDNSSAVHFKVDPAQTLLHSTLDPRQALVDLQNTSSNLKVKPGALQQLQVNPQLTTPDQLQRLQSIDLNSNLQAQPSFLSSVRNSSSVINPSAVSPAEKLPIIKSPPSVAAKTYTKNWNIGVGSPGTFAAYLNGKLQVTGHPTFTKASAEGNAGGYIFNHNVNLLRATANVNSQKAGNASVGLQLNALGQTVYNFQDSKNTLLVKSDTFSKSYDKTVAKIYFSLGPIPMEATFGVKGKAGINYSVIANPVAGHGYAKVNPFVDVKAYGQGGAYIVVGGAGLGADLTLLRDDLDIRASALLGVNASNKPYLTAQLSAYNEISALSGNAYAYAYVYVPRWGLPPWKKKQWNWNIFSWNGLKNGGYLFDESYTTSF